MKRNFREDARALRDHYITKDLESFLPFTLRYARMIRETYSVSYMAKDTHYYWATDEEAFITEPPLERLKEKMETLKRKQDSYEERRENSEDTGSGLQGKLRK
jgi:hypothetical protein